MELDDIKKWLDTSVNDIGPVNDPVLKRVHQQSRNPLAHLARKMKVGLIFFPLAVTLFATDFIAHPVARLSILKWMLLGILSIEFLDLLLNYQLVKQLLNPCGNIKFNFLARVTRLFVTAVSDSSIIKEIALSTSLPLNVVGTPKLSSIQALSECGVRRISMAVFLYKASYNQLDKLIKEVNLQESFVPLF